MSINNLPAFKSLESYGHNSEDGGQLRGKQQLQGNQLERNSRKVREMELETPPCPCPPCHCPPCPCPKIAFIGPRCPWSDISVWLSLSE